MRRIIRVASATIKDSSLRLRAKLDREKQLGIDEALSITRQIATELEQELSLLEPLPPILERNPLTAITRNDMAMPRFANRPIVAS